VVYVKTGRRAVAVGDFVEVNVNRPMRMTCMECSRDDPLRLYTAKRSGAASVEVMMSALGLDFEMKDATPWSDPPGPFFED